MHPVLVSIGRLSIPTFDVFFILGYIIAVFFVFRSARGDIAMIRAHISEEVIFDIVIFTTLFGLLGARITYLALHFQDFGLEPLKWILFTYFQGLYLVGGIFGALAFLFFFAKAKKYPLFVLLDYLTLGFLIAAPFGYIGGFFGEKIGNYPVQLFETLIMLLLLALLLFAKKKRIIRSDGTSTLTFLIIFAIVTCGFEFLRFDKTYIAILTHRQVLSLLLLSISGGTFIGIHRKNISVFLRKRNLLW